MGSVERGWAQQRRLPLLLFLLLVAAGFLCDHLVSGQTAEPECHCYSSGWTSDLEDQLNALTYDASDYTSNSYPGVLEGGAQLCKCYDVVPMTATVKVTRQSLVDDLETDEDRVASNATVLSELRSSLVEKVDSKFTGSYSRVNDVRLHFSRTTSSPAALEYDLYVFMKGNESTLETMVTGNEFDDPLGIEGIEIDGGFKVAVCSTPADLENGILSFGPGGSALGTTAKYACNSGFKFSNSASEIEISCGYDLTWSTMPDGVTCVADDASSSGGGDSSGSGSSGGGTSGDTNSGNDDAASGDAAKPGVETRSSSDCDVSKIETLENGSLDHDGSGKDGSVIKYTCNKGINPSVREDVTVKCESGVWSDMLPAKLICSKSTCSYPPQVPDFGVSDWDKKSFVEKTTIKYGCIEDHVLSTDETEVVIECKAGKWSKTTLGFTCEPKGPKKEPIEKENLFVMVTIPAAGGLVMFILCCMCLTRVDSPLCTICSSKEAP